MKVTQVTIVLFLTWKVSAELVTKAYIILKPKEIEGVLNEACKKLQFVEREIHALYSDKLESRSKLQHIKKITVRYPT